MITTQRAFQANARVISTADEILKEMMRSSVKTDNNQLRGILKWLTKKHKIRTKRRGTEAVEAGAEAVEEAPIQEPKAPSCSCPCSSPPSSPWPVLGLW